MVSHGCDERIVARNDCIFVCATTSNVHVISPLVGGGGFGERGSTWMVTSDVTRQDFLAKNCSQTGRTSISDLVQCVVA
jgi:hypothetical protein